VLAVTLITYAVDKEGAANVNINGLTSPACKELGLAASGVSTTNKVPALFSLMATDSIVAATLPVFLMVTVIVVCGVASSLRYLFLAVSAPALTESQPYS